jgi:hypothetical protein
MILNMLICVLNINMCLKNVVVTDYNVSIIFSLQNAFYLGSKCTGLKGIQQF